ncbi:MAG: VPGUxxT family thioredoxin-like (seleno)protein, type 2 [Verrucomicrobiota bacterium]
MNLLSASLRPLPTPRHALFLGALAMLTSACQGEPSQPVETGTVTWKRDLGEALGEAKESGKPVFLLFQEVPGCAGCRQFGKEVLSHPALVEIIEDAFVPLLIRNNQPGRDAEVLAYYREPAWNYQVVRFVDEKGQDLIPRRDRVWELEPLAKRMIQALERAEQMVPTKLTLLAEGKPVAAAEEPSSHRLAAFAMHCFWTGELELGKLDGVHRTEAGWLEGREVTLVDYDPSVLPLETLVRKAAAVRCAEKVYLPRKEARSPESIAAVSKASRSLRIGTLEGYETARASDQKKQLQGTPFAQLDLTPEQATKVNAWARRSPRKALEFLTEEQRAEVN